MIFLMSSVGVYVTGRHSLDTWDHPRIDKLDSGLLYREKMHLTCCSQVSWSDPSARPRRSKKNET